MMTGKSAQVSITMKNAGTQPWSAGISLASQNPENNLNWGVQSRGLEANETIAPGAAKTFTFAVKAPMTPGTYDFQFQMSRLRVGWFGDKSPNVAVVVSAEPPNQLPTGSLVRADSAIGGWAADPDTPSDPIMVHLYLDGVPGSCPEPCFAQDVRANLGRVDGNAPVSVAAGHQFDAEVLARLRDGKPHVVHAYGIDSSGGGQMAELAGSPKTFTLEKKADQPPIGWLDPGEVPASGWALDLDTPETPIWVHLYYDGMAGSCTGACFVQGLQADRPRPDVNDAVKVRGDHGFSIKLPRRLYDGHVHTLRAYGIDAALAANNRELSGSPVSFRLPIRRRHGPIDLSFDPTKDSVPIARRHANEGSFTLAGASTILAASEKASRAAVEAARSGVADGASAPGGSPRAGGPTASASGTDGKKSRRARSGFDPGDAKSDAEDQTGNSLTRCTADAKLPEPLYGPGILRASQLRPISKSLVREYNTVAKLILEQNPDFMAKRPPCLSPGAHVAYAMNARLADLGRRCDETAWQEPDTALTWDGFAEVGRALVRCGSGAVDGECDACPEP